MTASDGKLVDAFVEYVERRGGGVSMVELEKFLTERNVEWEGDLELARDDVNVVFWGGVNTFMSDFFNAVKADDRVKLVPTQPFVYHVDGKVPNLPVAIRPPRQGYKKPHWIPVAFNTTAKR